MSRFLIIALSAAALVAAWKGFGPRVVGRLRKKQLEPERNGQEEAQRAAERDARRLREEEPRRKGDAEDAARRKAEEEARRNAEEESRRLTEEQARRKTHEEPRRAAEEEARRLAEEQTRREAEEEAQRAAAEARRLAEEDARRKAEAEEAARRKAEEEAQRAGEQERRRAAEEQAGREAEKEDRRKAQEDPRRKPKPSRYRGLRRRPTIARSKNTLQPPAAPVGVANLNTLRVRVQLTFARHGGVKAVRLIPYRSKTTPPELEVIDTDTQDILRFTELRNDCYTPIALGEASETLHQGVRWLERCDAPRWCWALGGRQLYVFAPGDGFGFAGFVSTDSLYLNERHVVMGKAELRDKVSAALAEAGCVNWAVLDEANIGVPCGWLVFTEVTPTRSVRRREDDPVFNSLCPLPNIKPQFVGGIRLERNVWLAGFPPRIRFDGALDQGIQVLIDGQSPQHTSDGAFEAPGWDTEGEHRLWFGDRAETYSLRTMREEWECWQAYDFGTGAAICGASTHRTDSTWWRQVRIPSANPLLIGARPGEIFCCRARHDVRSETILALVPFAPVWALPLDPLHADKRSARLVPLDSLEPVSAVGRAGQRRQMGEAVRGWVAAINDAGRKQLALSVESDEARALWRRYRATAKHLWRGMR